MINTIKSILNFDNKNKDLNEMIEMMKKDEVTKIHSINTAVISYEFGLELNFSKKNLSDLTKTSFLHDFGKLIIFNQIKNKEDELNYREWNEIIKHPLIGSRMIEKYDFSRKIIEGIKHHHECYDGSGYPDGLLGSNIPLYSRIISISDAYEVMKSGRIYKEKMELDKIIREFELQKGKQFDPDLTESFLNIIIDLTI